jgi:hypothetical protein
MPGAKNARRDNAGPSEDTREAQNRASGGKSAARSPNDRLEMKAPTQQKNARGHRTIPQRKG